MRRSASQCPDDKPPRYRSWFLPALRQRIDIALVDPVLYFDKAGVPR